MHHSGDRFQPLAAAVAAMSAAHGPRIRGKVPPRTARANTLSRCRFTWPFLPSSPISL